MSDQSSKSFALIVHVVADDASPHALLMHAKARAMVELFADLITEPENSAPVLLDLDKSEERLMHGLWARRQPDAEKEGYGGWVTAIEAALETHEALMGGVV